MNMESPLFPKILFWIAILAFFGSAFLVSVAILRKHSSNRCIETFMVNRLALSQPVAALPLFFHHNCNKTYGFVLYSAKKIFSRRQKSSVLNGRTARFLSIDRSVLAKGFLGCFAFPLPINIQSFTSEHHEQQRSCG